MSTIDIVLVVFLIYFAYQGFSSGFIISVTTLLGMLLGFYAAAHFSEYLVAWLQKDMGMKSNNIQLIAYIITFVIVVVLVYLLGKFMTSVLKTVGLGIINRLAGAAFGILKGALIASFIFMLFNRVDPNETLISKDKKGKSILYQPVAKLAPMAIPVLQKYTDKAKELIKKHEPGVQHADSTKQTVDPRL